MKTIKVTVSVHEEIMSLARLRGISASSVISQALGIPNQSGTIEDQVFQLDERVSKLEGLIETVGTFS